MTKIHALIIFEILGKPAEHVKDSLNSMVEKVGAEKGVTLLSKKVHEPVPVKDNPELFTSFAEAEVELLAIENYFGIIFAYMPSHIEIVHPESMMFTNFQFNELGNQIIGRLHTFDAITKKALMDSQKVLEKLREVAPHLFKDNQTASRAIQASSENKKVKSSKSSSKKKSKKK